MLIYVGDTASGRGSVASRRDATSLALSMRAIFRVGSLPSFEPSQEPLRTGFGGDRHPPACAVSAPT